MLQMRFSRESKAGIVPGVPDTWYLAVIYDLMHVTQHVTSSHLLVVVLSILWCIEITHPIIATVVPCTFVSTQNLPCLLWSVVILRRNCV